MKMPAVFLNDALYIYFRTAKVGSTDRKVCSFNVKSSLA